MSNVVLTATNLARTSSRDDRALLNSIHLELHAGHCTALIGPAGSGKTVLLRALAWLDPLDDGEVLLDDQSPKTIGVPNYRRQVIYVHQSPWLPEGSVEQALRQVWKFNAARASGGEASFAPTSIKDRLNKLDRDESFLQQNTADLSGGERQIVALLRAMQLGPRVLLLDEPTSALDAQTRGGAEQLVQQFLTDDPTRAVLLVTHDLEQADRLSQRKIHIRDGQLEQS